MPHLIIEYAEALATAEQLRPMIDAVHQAAVASGLFEEENIKTRVRSVAFYRTGTGQDPFIHAQLRILSGRSQEQKKLLSEGVLAAIRKQGWAAKIITVEVVDMDRATYSKYPD